MKTIFCQKEEEVDLGNYLSQAQPIVFALEPYSGMMSFKMRLPPFHSPSFLCFHQAGEPRNSTIPAYTEEEDAIPECFLLLTKCQEGFGVYICLSHKDIVVRIAGEKGKGLFLCCTSGASLEANLAQPVLLTVQGEELYQTINLAMRLAIQLVGGKGKLAEEKSSIPSWLERLGWESGASFGMDVTHDKIVNAVWGLRDLGIQPAYVIIDEGWQEACVFGQRSGESFAMKSFEADPDRFPFGIKGLTDELQRAGVGHIGLWHGIMGYRRGIHSHLAEGYGLTPNAQGISYLGEDLGKTFQFYYDFYGYLRNQGISFVKVGAQNQVGKILKPGMDITKIYHNLQAAIQAAASIQFDTPPLNTECLINENLFYWTTSRLASAGDLWDFQNASTCKSGIRNLLANSLWLQHLMKPDFNPWITSVMEGESLGVLHALSGSTIVISDPPGKNREGILKKIVLPSGNILKTDRPLSLCQESVFQDPLKHLKILKTYTYKGENGIVAVFNLHIGGATLTGKAFPSDVPGISGDKFAAFSHQRGFLRVVRQEEAIDVTLSANGCDIITFCPVANGVAVIGSSAFFLAPGPILETTIEEESVHVSSLVTTSMLMYCERQVLEVRRNGEVVAWDYDNQLKLLNFDINTVFHELPAMYNITFE